MLAKEVVHRVLFKLYFVVAGVWAEIRMRGERGTKVGGVVATQGETRKGSDGEMMGRNGSVLEARVEGPLEEPERMIGAPVQGRPGTPPLSVRSASHPPPSSTPLPRRSLLESSLPSPPPSLPESLSPPSLLIEYNPVPEPSTPFALSSPPRQLSPQPPPPSPQLHQRSSPSSLRLASSIPHHSPPTPPPEPQHQLHSPRHRHRHGNNDDRYRSEQLPSPRPSTPYPAAGYGRRPFVAHDEDDGGGSVVANMIDNSQRGVRSY
ncbi:hypothetical protein F4811DRAFT_513623 [Daldinia bambusicola]|nr:hypothetical protein F4811DRAFT_513623 [Daldinia bambusicola]